MPQVPHAAARPSAECHDAIVVGGSYAGMSAALQLARARRRVLVIDAGEPRNRVASRSHGFLSRDGDAPEAIAACARAQLLAYPGVTWREERVVAASRADEGEGDSEGKARRFRVHCDSGASFEAARLVLAFGVTDVLPDVPGLAERWGQGVFHCPYCHGYEIAGGRLGVIAETWASGCQQARLMADWGQVTLFCADPADDEDEARQALRERGVVIESVPVRCLADTATVELVDGRRVVLDGIFISPGNRLSSPLAEQLGCELEEAGCITTDAAKQTTVEGVFACGDAARMAGSIALAVGEGALAGVAAHRSLLGLLDR